jgi:uncharacterized protein YjiK
MTQWMLPDRLREISGLALTRDERLLAVDDEVAIVYEINYDEGRLVKAFAVGEPAVRGDFEGIAVLDDVVWLMTSDGELYAAAEGADGGTVGYEHFDTKLGKQCELEGLAEVPERGSLLLLCKDGRSRKKLRMHEWHPQNGLVRETKLPEKDMEQALGRKRINPTGLARDPQRGGLALLAGVQWAIFELDHDAALIDVIMRLDKDLHKQAEGIAITRDGRLLVADEGATGRARLAVYRLKRGE